MPGCGQIESVVQNGQSPKQWRSCSRHPPWLSLRTARTGVTAAKPGRNRGHESVNSVCGRAIGLPRAQTRIRLPQNITRKHFSSTFAG